MSPESIQSPGHPVTVDLSPPFGLVVLCRMLKSARVESEDGRGRNNKAVGQ